MDAGEDKLHGLPEEERQRINKMAAEAITEAAFKEQVLLSLPRLEFTVLSFGPPGETFWRCCCCALNNSITLGLANLSHVQVHTYSVAPTCQKYERMWLGCVHV